MINRILAATFALVFAAAPAFAQSATGTQAPIVPPPSAASGIAELSPDRMGEAANTGDTTRAPSITGTDPMSTSAVDVPSRDGSTIPTQGMGPAGAATATETTPSGGIVPGQSSN